MMQMLLSQYIISGQKEILGLFKKNCRIEQIDNEKDKILMLTDLPIIQQVYIQLSSDVNQDFFIWPLVEKMPLLGASSDYIVKVMKLMNVILEASINLYTTYHPHYNKNSEMIVFTWKLFFSGQPLSCYHYPLSYLTTLSKSWNRGMICKKQV